MPQENNQNLDTTPGPETPESNNSSNTEEATQQLSSDEQAVIEPSDIGFDQIQKDQCAEKDFVVAAPFCPSCIIDESATPDDWRSPSYEEEAFLDKTKCEYVAVVEVDLDKLVGGKNDTTKLGTFNDLRKEYFIDAVSEYLKENPDQIQGVGLLKWYSEDEDKRPPKSQELWEKATDKARDEINLRALESGNYRDTKNGKKNSKFTKLIDWARDPDRIRLGIRTILDEFGKMNNDRTVCAFGGCQYSFKDVEDNKENINNYLMKMSTGQKWINDKLQTPKYSMLAGGTLTALFGASLFTPAAPIAGIVYGAVAMAGVVGKVWDILSISYSSQAEKDALSDFDNYITGFLGADIKNSLMRLRATYGTINEYAMEWHAYVPDDGVYLLPDSNILRYTVRIPAFNVDMLPDAEKDGEEDEDPSDQTITIDNENWRVEYTRLSTGLTLMGYEYDIFRIKDGGSIQFDEEGATSFDMLDFKPVKGSLKNFKDQLEKLLNRNKLAFSYQKGNPLTFFNYFYHKQVNNVRIDLKAIELNGQQAFQIKDVFVTIEACPEVKLTEENIVSPISKNKKDEGLIKKYPEDTGDGEPSDLNIIYKKVKGLKKFIKKTCGKREDYTMLNLLAKKDQALMSFQAKEKKSIGDWSKTFIFPKVIVNEGMSLGREMGDKTTLQCVFENFPLMSAESWGEILNDLFIGTWDVFRDELRTRMCRDGSSQIDPGLQRWFASTDQQAAINRAYEAEKQRFIEQTKLNLESLVKEAKATAASSNAKIYQSMEAGFTKGSNGYYEEQAILQSAASKEYFDAAHQAREQSKAIGAEQAAPAPNATPSEIQKYKEAKAGWRTTNELVQNPAPTPPPTDILTDPDALDAWKKQQLELALMDFTNKESTKAFAETFSKSLKELDAGHPYKKDLQEAIKAGIPNYNQTLGKKFYDIITGSNPTTDGKDEQEKFMDFLSDIGLCGLVLGLKQAMSCLFGKLKLEDVIKTIFMKVVGELNIDQFLYFATDILPVDKQLEVQEKVQQKIDNMFKGIIVPVGPSGVLSRDLYETNNQPSSENSVLNFTHDKGSKLKTKLSTIMNGRDSKKIAKLSNILNKDGSLKTKEQFQKDENKMLELSRRMKKRKEKVAERQAKQQKTFPKQGSVGKESAEIIGVIFKAYVDTIIETFTSSGLLQMIKELPVIAVIPDFIFDFFSCPKKSFFDPPLKMQNVFNWKKPNFCDPTRPIIDWNFIGNLQNPFMNPWKFLRDAIVSAITQQLTAILIRIVVQFIIELEKLICKLLEATGKTALNAISGGFAQDPLLDVFRDIFCGGNADDEKAKDTMAAVLATTGIASKDQARDAAMRVAGAMSGNFTKQEMMMVIFKPNQNPELLQRITNAIRIRAPELESFFNPPTKAAEFMSAITNLIPNSQQEQISQAIGENPLGDTPLFDTICLTDAEYDQWNNLRQTNLENRGLSPEDASDQVDKYNKRAEDTLISIIDQPGNIEDSIMQMLRPVGGKDAFGDPDTPPGCDDEGRSRINGMIDEPQEIVSLSNAALDRAWRVVGLKFASDLYGKRHGVISRILTDTAGLPFSTHGFMRNFFLTRRFVYDSKEQEEAEEGFFLDPFALLPSIGYFPKTVSLHLFQELQKPFNFKSRTSTTDILNRKKLSSEYNPFGIKPPITFDVYTEEMEKAEASMDYLIPITKVTLLGYKDETGVGKKNKFKQSVSYSSQVLLPEIEENFNYTIRVVDKLEPFLITGDMKTGRNQRYRMVINQPVSSRIEEYLSDFVVEYTNKDKTYRHQALEYVLGNILNKYLPNTNIAMSKDVYDNFVTKCLGIFRDICLDTVPRDGQIEPVEVQKIDDKGKAKEGEYETVTVPNGFHFGYLNSDFTEDETTYVGPDGEEYDYDEEEQILGRMKKPNPRLKLLDPKRYGGTYNSPPWYIDDPKYFGWMGMARILAPDISGCKPEQQDILNINEVMKHVKTAKNKIKLNEKFFSGREDCFYHIPFDRLIGRESRSMIEGCIKTVIRVNIVEHLIGALPVMGFIEYNEKNYDSSFAQMIAKRVQQDLATTNVGMFPRKIEKQNYWLSFLEQAVQMYWRMWESDELEYKDANGEPTIPEHIEEIFEEIRSLQQHYNWKEGMWRNPNRFHGITSDAGLFGDRSNRRFLSPGHYYDFDKKESIDVNLVETPIYEMEGPIPITYEEYMSAADKVFSEEEALQTLYNNKNLTGGAYMDDPTASELVEGVNSETGEPLEGGWLSHSDMGYRYARYNKVQTGTERVRKQSPIYGIDGPYPATEDEFRNRRDDSTGEKLLPRNSLKEAAEYGGIYNEFLSQEEGYKYTKYRKIITGYRDERTQHDPFDFQRQYSHYCALAYQIYGDSILYSDDNVEMGDSIKFGPSKSSWQFASCMWAVRSMQDECMVILSELINFELKQIIQAFNKNFKPDIVDISRYILNTNLFIDNKLKNFGTRDYEERMALGSIGDYGEVSDVVIDSTVETSFMPSSEGSPDPAIDMVLENAAAEEFEADKIKFKIEKYIRIVEKEMKDGKKLPEPFRSRDITLKGVVNLEHFQNFINGTKEQYGEYYLSDLFGDAERMLEFDFAQVFRILVDKFIQDDRKESILGKQIYHGPISILEQNDEPDAYLRFMDEYKIELTAIQEQAFIDKALVDGEKYGSIALPLKIVNEPWFNAAYIQEVGDFSNNPTQNSEGVIQGTSNLKSTLRGTIGVKYGMRIVANLPAGSGIPAPSLETIGKAQSALEKCFYMNFVNSDGTLKTEDYEKYFSLPIATAEIDVIDHKIKDFNYEIAGGESEYPMDVDCLLRKIVESEEYKLIFEHILNPKCVTSMSTILSSISFESGIGYKDGWERVKETEDSEGEQQDSTVEFDQDIWDGKRFEDTKMLVRKIFSGFYLSDDFESPDVEIFDFAAIIQAAFGSITGWLKKQGAGISFSWRKNYQDSPFDANGEECKSEYEKLLE